MIYAFIKQRWLACALATLVLGYLFVTSGIAGVAVAGFPGPDRVSYPTGMQNVFAFVYFGVYFSGLRLFYPLLLESGEWPYSQIQLPLALAASVTTAIIVFLRRRKPGGTFAAAFVAYTICTLTTNEVAHLLKPHH
jgi:hypothetical protein